MKNERILLTRDSEKIEYANTSFQGYADAVTALAAVCGVTHTPELTVCLQDPMRYALGVESDRLLSSMAGLKIPKYAIEAIAELEPEKIAGIEKAVAGLVAARYPCQSFEFLSLFTPDAIAFKDGVASVTQAAKDRITEKFSLYASTPDEIETLRLLQLAIEPIRRILTLRRCYPTKMFKFQADGTVEIIPQSVKWTNMF